MNLIDRAASVFTNSVPQPGSPAESQAIVAACNVGFNAPSGSPMPTQFEKIPLLREWYSIGLKARVSVCHFETSDGLGLGR